MEKIFDIAKDSEQTWGIVTQKKGRIIQVGRQLKVATYQLANVSILGIIIIGALQLISELELRLGFVVLLLLLFARLVL